MINNNDVRKKENFVPAILFLSALLVLFWVVAFVWWPSEKVIHLNEAGIEAAECEGKWCILEQDGYQVLGETGVYKTQDSTFYTPITYYYFEVLVNRADGENFVIMVRTNHKTNQLRERSAPSLYGMISKIDESTQDLKSVNLPNVPEEKVYHLSLNDNDENAASRYLNSMIFFLLGCIDVFFIYKVIYNCFFK